MDFCNDLVDLLFGLFLARTEGKITYYLKEVAPGRTEWTRDIHYYHRGGYFGLTALVWRITHLLFARSQLRGAKLFVERVRNAINCGKVFQ